MLTIFEKSVDGEYYIKLEIDTSDVELLSAFSIASVSVIETLMGSSPYLNIKFIDAVGELINQYPIIPDNIFHVTYGTTKESSVLSKFKMSTMKYELLSNTDVESILVSSDMIHYKWEDMIKKTYSKSWKEKKYSDVVADVIKDIGFDKTDIEPTKGIYDVLQPNWTNSNFLKWLTKQSTNESGIGGYAYYLTLDNKFVYSSFDNLFNKSPKKTLKHSSTDENGKGFNFFTIKNNYIPTLNHGGFGMDYMYFDYETKTYVQKDKVLTDIDERQLSDWYYVAESNVEPSKLFYGGRDTKTEEVVQNRILSTANSVQNVEIYISGDSDLHVGDLINLHIPVSKKVIDNSVINEVYSGYWMIWKAAHLFDIDGGLYTSQLSLTRNGINGKYIDGLVKTNKGKELI